MVLGPLPGDTARNRDLVDDYHIAAEQWLNQNGFPKANSRFVMDATPKVASENKFNPLTYYLNVVEWDGEKRIDKWLVECCGAEDTEYVREVGARWMIAAVARAMKPGCKVDTMLVLESPQGARKSTAVRMLAGAEFYGDKLPDMTRKDTQE